MVNRYPIVTYIGIIIIIDILVMLVLYPLMPSSQLIDSSLMYTIFQLILGLPIALIISRKQNQMTHKITQMTSEITQMTSEITQMTCDKKNHEDLQRKYESEKVYPILEDLDCRLYPICSNTTLDNYAILFGIITCSTI